MTRKRLSRIDVGSPTERYRHNLEAGAFVTPSSDLVSRLWRLCSLLRKDGVTYPQYVAELTYLIFLKLASERSINGRAIPTGHRWCDLRAAPDETILERYRETLVLLGKSKKSRIMQAIFMGAATVIREPSTLRRLIAAIDSAEWYSEQSDAFGDTYEGLLQKNAEETKRGAGQYFTPRPLVDAIVELIRPQPGEVIQDPAAGTGGFLIAANKALRDGWQPADENECQFQTAKALRGVENVIDTYRLLCMNLYLHGLETDHVLMGDTLSPLGCDPALQRADVILSNPPFGPSGSKPTRDDLPITGRSTSFQLPFVEHCMRVLAPGGRAAVVVPDNVLFETGRARGLRQALMRECDLHTILRLPTGIFYAQGIRTNVLFFSRPLLPVKADATDEIWIYDLRANACSADRGGQALAAGLADFVTAFGKDPRGRAERIDGGEGSRFRRFSRDHVAARNDDLYIVWLKESADVDEGLEFAGPEEVATAVERHLVSAIGEIRALINELEEDRADEDAAG